MNEMRQQLPQLGLLWEKCVRQKRVRMFQSTLEVSWSEQNFSCYEMMNAVIIGSKLCPISERGNLGYLPKFIWWKGKTRKLPQSLALRIDKRLCMQCNEWLECNGRNARMDCAWVSPLLKMITTLVLEDNCFSLERQLPQSREMTTLVLEDDCLSLDLSFQ